MRNLNGFEIAGRTLRVDNGEIYEFPTVRYKIVVKRRRNVTFLQNILLSEFRKTFFEVIFSFFQPVQKNLGWRCKLYYRYRVVC
jgi:hypothetical protein